MKNNYKRIEFGEVVVGELAKKHLLECIDTNWISMGPKVAQFEDKWSRLFHYRNSVAMSSGTDSIINACLTLYDLVGAKRGDEIIVPALGFIATANAIRAAGFIPVFVDVLKETLNIDEDKIEEAITDTTKAIIAVHTMGKPCNMKKLYDISQKHDLILIEDACEAHAAKYQGHFVGHYSHMVCFSFYIAHLVCCGEGGMVSCSSDYTAKLLRSTRNHGRPFNSDYFDHQRTGLNSKMNDMEASLGLEGVEYFWNTFDIRYDTMKELRKACVGFEDVAWFSEEDEGDINTPHGFSVTCKKEGDIQKITDTLNKYNIHWKRTFGSICTQHDAFKDMGYKLGDFPNAEFVGNNSIHFGLHQYLTIRDKYRIMTALKEGLNLCQ